MFERVKCCKADKQHLKNTEALGIDNCKAAFDTQQVVVESAVSTIAVFCQKVMEQLGMVDFSIVQNH